MHNNEIYEEKTYPMKLDHNYDIVTANDLMRGKMLMTARQADLIILAISQVVKEDKDFKTFTTSISKLAKFWGISTDSLYRDLPDICRQLRELSIEIKRGTGKKMYYSVFGWISMATIEEGMLTLRLSDDIKPYILELNNHFTIYPIHVLFDIRNFYAKRLYMYLLADKGESYRQEKDEWFFTVQQIREMYRLDEKKKKKGEEVYAKYPRDYDLIKYTISSALDELNASDYAVITDRHVLQSTKKGNPITGVSFKAKFFRSKEEKDEYLHPERKNQTEGQLSLADPRAAEMAAYAAACENYFTDKQMNMIVQALEALKHTEGVTDDKLLKARVKFLSERYAEVRARELEKNTRTAYASYLVKLIRSYKGELKVHIYDGEEIVAQILAEMDENEK